MGILILVAAVILMIAGVGGVAHAATQISNKLPRRTGGRGECLPE